jgi:aspartate kinase
VAARLFDSLGRVGISLRMIATSEVRVSCLIQGDQGDKALRTAAQAFELDEHQLHHNPAPGGVGEPEVRGVALDNGQAQLTVTNVPDRPGSAAQLCRVLADAGLSLDTIVQSERRRQTAAGPCRDIAFTLPRADRERARAALQPLLQQWGEAVLSEGPAIARVSAVGAGMPATAGTAARMFRALADGGVNIEMIATSEIRISCVVAEADGIPALRAVHGAFGLGGQLRHRAEGTEAPQG